MLGIIVLLVGVLILAIGYLMVLVTNAKWDAKSSPRAAMHICDVHGAIPDTVLLKLEGATENPIQTCPFCFQNKMKAAKEGGLISGKYARN